MKLIDLHCDTLLLPVLPDVPKQDDYLRSNSAMVDIEKLQRAGSMAQFFAIFINSNNLERYGHAGYEPWDFAMVMYRYYLDELEKNEDILAHANNYDDLTKHNEDGKISAFLTVEEGGILDDRISRVDELYNKGFRLITLLWNIENCIGYPQSGDPVVMSSGLKPFGREVVDRMNRLGMLIDVSHISDGCFHDILEASKAPVIASHSNARSATAHPRNLTDEMIRALAEKGGVTGINYAPKFLYEVSTGCSNVSLVSDMVRHIKHIRNIGGIEVLALGSDFDGIGGELEIGDISQTEKLYSALKAEGFSESDLEKVWYENAVRVIKDVL